MKTVELRGTHQRGRPAVRPAVYLTAVAVVTAVSMGVLNPGTARDLASVVGFGVCHQLPAHSFAFGGQPFPLCARCTGSFLGFVLGVVSLVALDRGRWSGLPTRRLWAPLGAAVALMALDGMNSYLDLVTRGAYHLYAPNNWFRFATGHVYGTVLALGVVPVFNSALWALDDPRPVLRSGWGLLGILGLAGGSAAGIALGGNWVEGPLAVAGALGAVGVFAIVNAVAFLMVTGRSQRAKRWRDAATALLVGVALTAMEIGALSALRASLGPWLIPT